jgi:hypothetical protein
MALAAAFGLDMILGAFAGGMVVGLVSRDGEALREKLDAIGHGYFVPFLFARRAVDEPHARCPDVLDSSFAQGWFGCPSASIEAETIGATGLLALRRGPTRPLGLSVQ